MHLTAYTKTGLVEILGSFCRGNSPESPQHPCQPLPNIIPYFLGYKTDFFSFQNNPKDLDPSYKTDLDL